MVAVESVGYLILYVRDVDVSAAFYRDVVGLQFRLRDAGTWSSSPAERGSGSSSAHAPPT